ASLHGASLSLEKCRELALKNNMQAKNAALSVEAAGQQRREAFTKYFPSVSATGMGVAFSEALMATEVETGYPAPNDKVQVDMIQNALVGGFMAMQPIFAGGQIIDGNRLAKAGLEASKLQRQMTENEVLLATERYFWQLVSMKEKIVTIKNAEALLDRAYRDVSIAVDAGLTTRNDLLRVELEQNRLESGKLKAENGLQIIKMALAQHIGLETDTFDIEMPADIESIALPVGADLRACPVEHRPEYKLLEKSVDVARLQRDMEIGKYLPTIAIGAGYSWVKVDLGLQTKMNKNVGLAFASVSVPISEWWGGSHAIKRKKIELMKAENIKQEKSDLLSLQMRQIRNELNEAYRQTLLAGKAISSAEENLKISHDNFNAGITILSDLLDAQNLLQQSRDQYTEATTEYFVKLAEYRQVTGE
ncbi:MAG: TolC family protein, partial [Prevotellaceae bacterium]|nr:TolC family protein [Prevotellaceae bacterium]